MSQKVNTYTQFLPLKEGTDQKIIIKNECYFSMIFLGGNYLTSGSIFQRIFGGSDEVTLIAGLRLQPDGIVITTVEEPNIVLDKRSIKPGKNTNIPMVLNILVKIPAYMDSIGFSFKVATTKRNDNFSVALDVLNDSSNKGVLDALVPNVVGKALGIGKVVKDMFDKLDAANNRDLIQLVVNDFIIPSNASSIGVNNLQEGYLVVFVKNESDSDEESLESQQNSEFILDDGFDNIKEIKKEETVFIDIPALEKNMVLNLESTLNLNYDEINKILKLDSKIVTNTYLVFKIQRDIQRGENLNSSWSKKFVIALELFSNEFDKSIEKLKELQPRVTQLLSEANALLSEESGFTPSEKNIFKEKYRSLIEIEKAKFK